MQTEKQENGSSPNTRIHHIEDQAILDLNRNGFSEFESDALDTAIMVKRVVESLFLEQMKKTVLLSSAQFKVETPMATFEQGKLIVVCRIILTKPAKMTFMFCYVLINSRKKGIIELESMENPKVTIGGNGIMKGVARKLLPQFNIVKTAKQIISDLNSEILKILICDHGKKASLKQVLIRINQDSLTIRLESKRRKKRKKAPK